MTAGIATSVEGEAGYPIGGGVFNAPDGLGRGDSYTADVYAPSPTERQLRDNDDTHYEDWLRSYVSIYLAEPGVATTDEFEDAQRAAAGRLAALGRVGPAGGRALRQLRRIRRGRPGEQRACGVCGHSPSV